jgi:hypothetical protein
MASHYTKTKRMHFTYLVYSLYTQIFTFWGDVRISILAFSLLKHQKQKKNKKKHAYLLLVTYFEVILCSCQFDNF